MSRPFSYNDENFTVIGSLLIIHVAYNGKLDMNDEICKVPPEIVKRVKYPGFAGVYNKTPYSPLHNISLYIVNYTLRISTPGNYSNGEFFAIIDLKDI